MCLMSRNPGVSSLGEVTLTFQCLSAFLPLVIGVAVSILKVASWFLLMARQIMLRAT